MATPNIDAGYQGVVSRVYFKEIIAQRDDLNVIDGGRIVPPAQDTVYQAGLVVAQYTSGPNAGLFVPYDSANASATDGSQKPVGFIYGGADVRADGFGSEIRVITKGFVFADLCYSLASGANALGLSTAIQTALGGALKLVHGQKVYAF